jgi:superfamily II DNA or RNA helicase
MRLAGKALQGYYPTPEPVLEAIVAHLKVLPNSYINILDNSAGTGRALAYLGKQLAKKRGYVRAGAYGGASGPPRRVLTYGVEPNQARFQLLRSCVMFTLRASWFQTLVSNEAFQFAFCNPPYDVDYDAPLDEHGNHPRLERTFLLRTTRKLAKGAPLALIIPHNQILTIADVLERHYTQIVCYRFPDDLWVSPEHQESGKQPARMYSDYFHQVVMLAVRRERPVYLGEDWLASEAYQRYVSWQNAGLSLPELRAETPCGLYQIPSGNDGVAVFRAGDYEPDRLAELLSLTFPGKDKSPAPGGGIWAREEYLVDHWPDPGSRMVSFPEKVLAPLRNGHVAVLATAGIANGQELEGKDGRRILIKGYSTKVTRHTATETEEAEIETWRDCFVTELWAVDLQTGKLIRVDTGTRPVDVGKSHPYPFESLSMVAFLDNFGPSLGQEVARTNPSVYEGIDQLPWAHKRLRELLRKPMNRQLDFILATVAGLVYGDGKHLISRIGKIAGMGCGKTFAALASAYLADERKECFPLLVLCPTTLTRKWAREAEMTIPGVRTIVVRHLSTQKESQELRNFDPSYEGGPISAVGCLERVIARIALDRHNWDRAMERYAASKRDYCARRAAWLREVWWPWKQAQDGSPEPACPVTPPGPPPKKPMHVVVISSSVAKLGMEWEAVYTMRPLTTKVQGKVKLLRGPDEAIIEVPHCPQCLKPLIHSHKTIKQTVNQYAAEATGTVGDDDMDEAAEERANQDETPESQFYLSRKQLDEADAEKRRKYQCMRCGSPLWQHLGASRVPQKVLPLPGGSAAVEPIRSTARRGYALATYIRKQARNFFKLLVTDEVHEGAHGTALGFARQELMEACERSIALTGTLSRGKASDILEFLYHMNPQVRKDFPYNAVEQWVDLYGIRQKTRKTTKEEEGKRYGASSKRRPSRTTIDEKPGFAPQGLQYVLRMCGFLELADVAPMLPPYREYVREVELSPELEAAYDTFEARITRELHAMLRAGDKSGLGPWYQALMAYPNMPYRGWICQVKRSGHLLGVAEALDEQELTSKERAIIDYVEEKVRAGRRVLLYTQYTGSLDTMPRWKHVLETHVNVPRPLKVKLLYSDTVKPIDREQWLREQVAAGLDVLICHPKLVQVGLDLIDFPSIAYESIPSSTPDFRQSARRAHRPGQTQSCDTTVFVYPTMERRLLKLMTLKMKISLMIEGSLPGEGLVTYGDEDDDDGSFMLQLARDILQDMENGVTRKSLEETGEELQALYEEIAELAKEQQQYPGEEPSAAQIDFEPVTIKTLASLSTEDGKHEGTQSPATKEEPKPITIVTIPTSQLLDPWAPYRAKVQELRAAKAKMNSNRKKKKPAAQSAEANLGLWAAFENASSLPKPSQKDEQGEQSAGAHSDLWSGLGF